jgi:hypothetical protein
MIVTKGLGGGNGLIITQGYGWFSAGQLFDVIHGSIVRIREFTETVPVRTLSIVPARMFLKTVADRVKLTVKKRIFKEVVDVRKNR